MFLDFLKCKKGSPKKKDYAITFAFPKIAIIFNVQQSICETRLIASHLE